MFEYDFKDASCTTVHCTTVCVADIIDYPMMWPVCHSTGDFGSSAPPRDTDRWHYVPRSFFERKGIKVPPPYYHMGDTTNLSELRDYICTHQASGEKVSRVLTRSPVVGMDKQL